MLSAQTLLAVGKGQHVVQHHLVDGQRKLFAVADDRHLRLREEGELVVHALGADFLKDADGGVAEYNADEQSVFIGADRQNGDGQQQIDDVEQRQQVVAEDARVGLRLYAGVFRRSAARPCAWRPARRSVRGRARDGIVPLPRRVSQREGAWRCVSIFFGALPFKFSFSIMRQGGFAAEKPNSA